MVGMSGIDLDPGVNTQIRTFNGEKGCGSRLSPAGSAAEPFEERASGRYAKLPTVTWNWSPPTQHRRYQRFERRTHRAGRFTRRNYPRECQRVLRQWTGAKSITGHHVAGGAAGSSVDLRLPPISCVPILGASLFCFLYVCLIFIFRAAKEKRLTYFLSLVRRHSTNIIQRCTRKEHALTVPQARTTRSGPNITSIFSHGPEQIRLLQAGFYNIQYVAWGSSMSSVAQCHRRAMHCKLGARDVEHLLARLIWRRQFSATRAR